MSFICKVDYLKVLLATTSQQLIGNIGYNLKGSFVKNFVENFMNNSMDNSMKNFRDNFRGQFQDSFRYNFKANSRDNFRTILQNLSVIVQLMELKDFSVLFSLEYNATELTGVILHGSTPTFRTFVMAKKGDFFVLGQAKIA